MRTTYSLTVTHAVLWAYDGSATENPQPPRGANVRYWTGERWTKDIKYAFQIPNADFEAHRLKAELFDKEN